LEDYDKAAMLWGGKYATSSYNEFKDKDNDEKLLKRFEGVNPYTLTFRGNTLARLNQMEKAIIDYKAASNTFIAMKDIARYSDARANYALALYQMGAKTGESKTAVEGAYSGASENELDAVKVMKVLLSASRHKAKSQVFVLDR
jgi:hypothetical protein